MKTRTTSHRLLRLLRRHRDWTFAFAFLFLWQGQLFRYDRTLMLVCFYCSALLAFAFLISFIRVPSQKGDR